MCFTPNVISVSYLNANCEVTKEVTKRSDIKEKISWCVHDIFKELIVQGITQVICNLMLGHHPCNYRYEKKVDVAKLTKADAPESSRLFCV